MKKKLNYFLTLFVGNFLLHYFFAREIDIPYFLFSSFFVAAMMTLLSGPMERLIVKLTLKAVSKLPKKADPH